MKMIKGLRHRTSYKPCKDDKKAMCLQSLRRVKIYTEMYNKLFSKDKIIVPLKRYI